MVIEPVIVAIIDKTRIESYLFWGSYIGKVRWALEVPQVVLVLGPRHRRERVVDGAPLRKVWRWDVTRRASPSQEIQWWSWPYNTIETRVMSGVKVSIIRRGHGGHESKYGTREKFVTEIRKGQVAKSRLVV